MAQEWQASVEWDNDDNEIVEFTVPDGETPRTFCENVLRERYQPGWRILQMKRAESQVTKMTWR
jgi:hypothetical protein